MQHKTTLLTSVLLCLCLTSPAFADKAIMVLDASGSMNAQINGETKIKIARKVIDDLVDGWPEATELGMIAYGHREKDNCGDIQTLVKPATDSWPAIKAAIRDVEPKGKTPLSDAVRAAAKELHSEEGKATVILVSDGLETCEADPCAAAEELEKSGVDFTVHVVGFGTTDEENRQLSCMADKTGGRFLGASNASELKVAMTKTVELVAKPEPTASDVIFSDSFDGEALGKQWEVVNESKDVYIVENGGLLMLTTKAGNLISAANSLRLNDVSLDGDWDMSITFNPDFASGEDQMQLGIVDNDNNIPIRATVTRDGYSDTRCVKVYVSVNTGDSQPAANEAIIFGGLNCDYGDIPYGQFSKTVTELKDKGGTLTLSKRGRNYHAQFTSPMLSKPVKTRPVTLLRASGRPSLVVNKYGNNDRQTSAIIDEFRMERIK